MTRRIHTFHHDAMATSWELRVAEAEATYARDVARAAFARLDQVEDRLSRFRTTSCIARFNALDAGGAMRLSPEAYECLAAAWMVRMATGGSFDPAYLSDGPRVADADVQFDPRGQMAGVTRPGIRMDLGAIGKGYAVDQVALLLAEWDIESAMISAGTSTVGVVGRAPGLRCWRASLWSGRAETPLGTVNLDGIALACSGDEVQGAHITDPRTGEARVLGANVWATGPSATLADAHSTAFAIMGPGAARAYCDTHPEMGAAFVAGEEERAETFGAFPPIAAPG